MKRKRSPTPPPLSILVESVRSREAHRQAPDATTTHAACRNHPRPRPSRISSALTLTPQYTTALARAHSAARAPGTLSDPVLGPALISHDSVRSHAPALCYGGTDSSLVLVFRPPTAQR